MLKRKFQIPPFDGYQLIKLTIRHNAIVLSLTPSLIKGAKAQVPLIRDLGGCQISSQTPYVPARWGLSAWILRIIIPSLIL